MAKLTSRGRPGSPNAIQAHCRECMNFNQHDCEIRHCPLYYWQPYRKLSPDLSWVSCNAYASSINYNKWMEDRKKPKLKLKIKKLKLKLKVKNAKAEKKE